MVSDVLTRSFGLVQSCASVRKVTAKVQAPSGASLVKFLYHQFDKKYFKPLFGNALPFAPGRYLFSRDKQRDSR